MIIAEHSIDLDRLPKQAHILDLGCRGFAFTKALRELGHLVTPVDVDQLNESMAYYKYAITDHDGKVGVIRTNDPQATRVSDKGQTLAPCYKLSTFTEMVLGKKKIWDAIKMDVEGSEYEIIMSMTKPMAPQLSIEFHLHTGVYKLTDMTKMEKKLNELGYRAESHAMSEQHGAGRNYWDSLFVL